MVTKTKYEFFQDVTEGDLLSAYVIAPFGEGLKVLQDNNYRLISLQENARLRMQEGEESYISRYGNWVLEDAIYIPNKGTFLTKVFHINENTREATNVHRDGKDFYLTNEQVKQCLADCVELEDNPIPTNRFGENEKTRYAFREDAEEYGNFLEKYGIEEMPIWLAEMQDKPFARIVWFGGLMGGDRSVLDGLYGDLCCEVRVRGVSKNSCEAAQKISAEEMKVEAYTKQQKSKTKLPYSQIQVNKMYEIVSGVREGRIPASKLEKILEFLEKLRK